MPLPTLGARSISVGCALMNRTTFPALFRYSPFSHCFSTSSILKPSQPSATLSPCIASLQAYAHQNNLAKGQELHCHILKNGLLSSPLAATSLINMYTKCGQMNDAFIVFDSSCFGENVYIWNAIIAGFVSNGFLKVGHELYGRMRREGVLPDKYTFPCAIKSCSEVSDLRTIHGELFKHGLELDSFVGSALVNSYLKFCLMEEAEMVFEKLPLRNDVVLWNSMINGYVQIWEFEAALGVFRAMGEEGVIPNRFTVTGILSALTTMGDLNNGSIIHGFVIKMGYESGVAVLNALIDMYGKCKIVDAALGIFEIMNERDIYSWNSILTVHEQSSDHEGTLKLFGRMLSAGIQPDLVTVTTVLPACAHLAALMHGKEIHSHMISSGLCKDEDGKDLDDAFVKNALMDMYAKCGNMREVLLVFNEIKDKDLGSWNIVIMAYGMHGFAHEALQMFSTMCEAKLKPDEITFVGLLSACNHSGFVSQGRDILALMESKYGVVPTIEHYTCVIDMLGRAGRFKEACELVVTMPIKANPVAWRALLAACWLHGNSDLAEVAARRLFELDSEHCGGYVLMSNVYGAINRYEEVSGVRSTMRRQNVAKVPGCSWIELKNGVHVFVTRDRTHLEADCIYNELNSLTVSLKEHVYAPLI